ncbi:MAG: DUF262 domain-containing protein [Clostridium lundense]|nr:DUF262 domain-containing protein [Clostridium lundense]
MKKGHTTIKWEMRLMKFSFQNMKINGLLNYNKCKLKVPRYQRDYSWEKEQIVTFSDDILEGLSVDEEKINTNKYFFGTVLLAGDKEKSNTTLEIIDGQQRITTITIFLSVLAKQFYKIEEENLGNLLWEYVMAKDYDGNEYKVLISDTTNHYFEYLVQMKEETTKEPIDEEQERIKFAYDYYSQLLQEENLRKQLIKLKGKCFFDNIEYLDILKAIRSQLLDSDIICIEAEDTKSSNLIFEILNGKGKRLDSIDLIKNTIFEKLNTVEPTDVAYNIWLSIKNNLLHEDESIEFQTFFRHYWLSKYKKVKDSDLYNSFCSTIEPQSYMGFIEDIESSSKFYAQIAWPSLEHYKNRKEFTYVVEYLNYLNKYLNIKQVRILLLALFEGRWKKETISEKVFHDILKFVHEFHFGYLTLCGKRANALESKYSKYAIKINNSKDKMEAHKVIGELKAELKLLFPEYAEFESKFIELEYSKKKETKNMLTKYVLNNLENYYDDISKISKVDGSIEHIVGEDKAKDYTLNIGNLILLEQKINGEKVENKILEEKMVDYKTSKYQYVKIFIEQYDGKKHMTKEMIIDRAKQMATDYYENVLSEITR